MINAPGLDANVGELGYRTVNMETIFRHNPGSDPMTVFRSFAP